MVILSAFMYLRTYVMPTGAAHFPRIILTVFVLFGIWILIQGIKKTKAFNTEGYQITSEDEYLTFSTIKLPMATLLIVIVYVAFIKLLGFFAITTIFIIGFMYFYQERNWKKIALTVFGIDLCIYLLFVLQLNVPLPKGLLF